MAEVPRKGCPREHVMLPFPRTTPVPRGLRIALRFLPVKRERFIGMTRSVSNSWVMRPGAGWAAPKGLLKEMRRGWNLGTTDSAVGTGFVCERILPLSVFILPDRDDHPVRNFKGGSLRVPRGYARFPGSPHAVHDDLEECFFFLSERSLRQ
jgi:hypothetical protein